MSLDFCHCLEGSMNNAKCRCYFVNAVIVFRRYGFQ
jgi:hypothetical protein